MDGQSVCGNSGFVLVWVTKKKELKGYRAWNLGVWILVILLSELFDTNLLGVSLPMCKMRGSESQIASQIQIKITRFGEGP